MAATRSLVSSNISAKIVYSTDQSTGEITYKTGTAYFPGGTKVVGSPDADKIISIKTALTDVMNKTISNVYHTRKDEIVEES